MQHASFNQYGIEHHEPDRNIEKFFRLLSGITISK